MYFSNDVTNLNAAVNLMHENLILTIKENAKKANMLNKKSTKKVNKP